MKDISSSVRILNSLFAVQNGEFIDRFSNSRWSRALNRSFSRKLSACRSIMRPRFLCTTTRADQAMADGLNSIEFIRRYTRVTPNSAGAIDQSIPISVFLFFPIATTFSWIWRANTNARILSRFRKNKFAEEKRYWEDG